MLDEGTMGSLSYSGSSGGIICNIQPCWSETPARIEAKSSLQKACTDDEELLPFARAPLATLESSQRLKRESWQSREGLDRTAKALCPSRTFM